jgi:hypothetical protein
VKVFFTLLDDSVMVQARAEDGIRIGDLLHEVKPGECFAGLSYAEIRELGDGEHDLVPSASDKVP